MMTADTQTIGVNGTTIREGTAIYDTTFDRVFWIAEINDYEIEIEVVEAYVDEEPIWWSRNGDPTRVADGSSMGIDKFRSLVDAGRFEIGPHPTDAETSS